MRYCKKLLLNLAIISLEVALIWVSIKAFTSELPPIIGTISVVGILACLYILITQVQNKYFKRRRPGMFKTTLSIILIVIIATFAGCQPLATYKDSLFGKIDNLVKTTQDTPPDTTTPIPPKTPTPIVPTVKPAPQIVTTNLDEIEREAFYLINQEREKAGLQPTLWDDKLYSLSKSHTEEMADSRTLFHSSVGSGYAENAWGASWGKTSRSTLASKMVDSWMSSPLHRASILYAPYKISVVSIVDDNRGQYASWTFYTLQGSNPPLLKKAYNMWQAETGGKIPWLTWLHDIKGYPTNTRWLEPFE